jgi:hypothetical protein
MIWKLEQMTSIFISLIPLDFILILRDGKPGPLKLPNATFVQWKSYRKGILHQGFPVIQCKFYKKGIKTSS